MFVTSFELTNQAFQKPFLPEAKSSAIDPLRHLNRILNRYPLTAITPFHLHLSRTGRISHDYLDQPSGMSAPFHP